MATPIIKTSFSAGEMAASLSGRVDLAKYQVGAAVMRNFFVDYRGGAGTRPGTKHVGVCRPVTNSPKPRLVPFVFNSEQAYVLELNANKMRVIYRGGYVTETALTITAGSDSDPLQITVPGHTYSVGDFVYVDGVNGLTRPNGISGVNGRTFYITAISGSVLTLGAITTFTAVNASTWTSYSGGGTCARIYEIATPWNASTLFSLKFVQSADVMTVTYLDFPAYDIRRLGNANWQIVQETHGTPLSPPTGLGAYPQNTGDVATQVFFYVYAVTSVDENGRESTIATASCENKALDQTLTPVRTNIVQWNAVPGAYKYRVYKSQPVPQGTQGGGPYYFGVVGNVFENRFVDVNYAPDFTVGPPIARNPFMGNGIASVNIDAAGAGYVAPYAVVTDGTGSGAVISLASDLSEAASPYGAITVANVVASGTNYTAPTVSIGDAAPPGSGLVLAFNGNWIANPLGTGFVPAPGSITISNGGQNYHFKTATAFVRARAANNPVGTNYLPIDIALVARGSVQAIDYDNADITPSAGTGLSSTGTGDDIDFEIVGSDVVAAGAVLSAALGGTTNPNCCAYLQQRRVFGGSRSKPSTLWMSQPGQFTNFNVTDPVQDDNAITAALNAQEVNVIEAMVAATGGLVVLTSGGAYLVQGDGNSGVTPTTIQANPQAFTGTQKDLQPLRAGNQLIYAQARGSAIAELAYNFYTSQFTSMDISVLSAHLLEGHYITQWAYATEPYKLVWAVRDDGVLLCMTYLKEQEVYGWSRHDTQGSYASVATVPEGREDAVYVAVRRYNPVTGYAYHVERMMARDFGADPAANVPANPEDAWCVDDGNRLALGTFNTPMYGGFPVGLGTLTDAVIDFAGSGYINPIVEITDLTGAGAEITLSVTGGVITGIALVSGGSGYTNPQFTIRDVSGGGGGAAISAHVANLIDIYVLGAFGSGGFEGMVFRALGGKGTVVSVISSDAIRVDFDRLPSGMQNYPGYILPSVAGGDWSLTMPVTVVGGLDHLNGATVQVLADGSVQTPQTVVDGCITLDTAASAVIVGLGFTCQLQTMRLEPGGETMQGRRKTIPTLVLRTKDTRGLTAGATWTSMVEVKEREYENFGEPIVFQDGGQIMPQLYAGAPVAFVPLSYPDTLTHLQTDYREEGQVCIQQSWPLPATVLAVIPFLNAGDTVK